MRVISKIFDSYKHPGQWVGIGIVLVVGVGLGLYSLFSPEEIVVPVPEGESAFDVYYEKVVEGDSDTQPTMLSCPISDTGISGKLYIATHAARITGTISETEWFGELTDVLDSGQYVYLWNAKTSKGYYLESNTLTNLDEKVYPSELNNDARDTILQSWGVDVESCKIVIYKSELFIQPESITFEPLVSSLVKEMANSIEEVWNSVLNSF